MRPTSNIKHQTFPSSYLCSDYGNQLHRKGINDLKKVARAATELNVETYLVGGFVRDKILNRFHKRCGYCMCGRWYRISHNCG